MFGTSGIRGPVGETVTAELALNVGRALASTDVDRVVVGRDARESGTILESALVAGLRECGADVIRLGQASTPATARAVSWRDADAGVMITASHNPSADNGLKFWTPSGQAFDADQRAELTRRVERERYTLQPWDDQGAYKEWPDAEARHRDALVAAGDDLSGLTIAVDIGNGVGGVTADALYDLGATVTTLNAQEDGRFPGRPSEPTSETCAALCAHVGATEADLGIAHDGDADRMLAVDDQRTFVDGDSLLALFGQQAASAGDQVAAPVNTSLAVDDALDAVGGSVTRTPVGDVHVAERTTEPAVVFGGEPSGAWIWPAETRCPDGPYAAVKLAELVAEQGTLAELTAALPTYPLTRTSIEVETATKSEIMERIREYAAETYDEYTTLDGVRVTDGDDGWFLVRASGTQPLVRITAQARTSDHLSELAAAAHDLVARGREDAS